MDIDGVIERLEMRRHEIDTTIQTLKREREVSSSIGNKNGIGRPKGRHRMTDKQKKAISVKLKQIWATRKSRAK